MGAFGTFQIRGRRVSPPSAASLDTTRNIPIVERQDQVDLYARKATLEYTASARYDESIDVGIKRRRIGNTSMLIGAAVFRGDQLLISGELVCVYANPATQTPLPVPPALRELLMAFEAGQPMVDVKLGDWDALGQAASAIRSAVFVDEQKIPATLEWDAADAGCVHALACNRFGLALTTGRLMPALEGVSKIGRMAVLASMRGSSIGRAVLDALVLAARHRGDKQLLLHAQASAVGFYSRAGFVAPGPVFSEAGITHQAMARMLRGVRLRLRSWLRSRLPSRQRSRLPPTPQSNVSNHSSWRG